MGVGIEEHLGRTVDLDLTFNDEDGKIVKLRDFFNKGRPVMLDLVYYNCPIVHTDPQRASRKHEADALDSGQSIRSRHHQYRSPRDLRKCARKKKASYMASFGKPTPGWHFLTDRDNNAKRLAE